jgi:hypothetical protein
MSSSAMQEPNSTAGRRWGSVGGVKDVASDESPLMALTVGPVRIPIPRSSTDIVGTPAASSVPAITGAPVRLVVKVIWGGG